jgi:hypothetical protein
MMAELDVIRVCIGTEPKLTLATRVLEFSIERRTRSNVRFHHMDGPEWDRGVGGHTGFSFRRWAIPEVVGPVRAIYLDADIVCLWDIEELWSAPERFPDTEACVWCAWKGRRPLVSVMVIDCERATNWKEVPGMVESGRMSKPSAMGGKWIKPRPVRIEDGWNHIDRYTHGETRMLHYSCLAEQPWFNPNHPFAGVWLEELRLGIERQVISRGEVESAFHIFGRRSGLHPDYRKALLS